MSHFNQEAPYAGSDHFVTHIGLRVAAPDGRKQDFHFDQRENHAKLGISHEVTASRAGSPSGRTA
jgi:hypothetical protein